MAVSAGETPHFCWLYPCCMSYASTRRTPRIQHDPPFVKIAFISSCLEPGKDGVGDYTTLLAGECERRGHATRLLALNDPHVDSAAAGAARLRLSSSLRWAERVRQAREFLPEFGPDFVSLQFVCYGFHPRGIDFALAGRLREIIGDCPVHIMFHELWIGVENGAPIKDRFFGSLQRACVLNIVSKLNVRSAHASNAAYVELLQERNIRASLLPLFGAIPFSGTGASLRQQGDTLVFGMFGSLHPVWPPEPLFSLLRKTGKKIVVAHIGRLGAGGALWEKMGRDYAGAIEFRRLGEQPAEKIAEFFRSETDFGIATTPWEIAGKSASVAAMLEHGLPVIVNRDDWHAGSGAMAHASPLLVKMDESLPEKIPTIQRAAPQSLLSPIAGQFLDSLGPTP